MNKEQYYNTMSTFSTEMSFKKIHEKWFQCFSYILKSFNVGHNTKTIESLFYEFYMGNWKAMHKDNTEYKDFTKRQLIEAFVGECAYICDRTSYDRLFRTHWLFLRAFEKEMDKLREKNNLEP